MSIFIQGEREQPEDTLEKLMEMQLQLEKLRRENAAPLVRNQAVPSGKPIVRLASAFIVFQLVSRQFKTDST